MEQTINLTNMDGNVKTLGDEKSVLILQGRQIAIRVGESTMILNLDKMRQLGIIK